MRAAARRPTGGCSRPLDSFLSNPAPGSYPKITSNALLDVAVHAADITVDKRGTVAAAATALGFAVSGPPEPELTVAANRPFIYLTRHRESGLVLFAGHVTDPA